MVDLVSLGPDECRADRSAACFYWHTKRRVMAGATVPADELLFVGFQERSPPCDGWKNAATHIELLYRENDHDLGGA